MGKQWWLSVCHKLYKWLIRPVLFRIDPEEAHNRAVRSGKILGSSGSSRWLIKKMFCFEHDSLQQKIWGVRFKNPIGLSAGFDKDAELINILPAVGFGYLQVGSVTARPYGGNEPPRLRRLVEKKSILVNYGLKNIGVDRIIEKIKRGRNIEVPFSVSVAKTNSKKTVDEGRGIEDYYECLSKLAAGGIGDMYTINISCPNAFGGEPFTEPDKLDRLLNRIRKVKFNKPMLVKMPVDFGWDEFRQLLDVVIKYGCQGVIIGNLSKDLNQEARGGVSGKLIEKRVNDLISKTYKYAGDRLIIVGVGGVFSAEDAYEKIKRGATLVQLITGMIFEGPQLIGQINAGLVEFLKRDGYNNISEAVGKSVVISRPAGRASPAGG